MRSLIAVITVLVLNLAAYRTMFKAPNLWGWIAIVYIIIIIGLLFATGDKDNTEDDIDNLVFHSGFMFIAAAVMLTIKFW